MFIFIIAIANVPDMVTVIGFGMFSYDTIGWDSAEAYSNVGDVYSGGLWYSNTAQAEFLRQSPGIAIN